VRKSACVREFATLVLLFSYLYLRLQSEWPLGRTNHRLEQPSVGGVRTQVRLGPHP
jgi:hypothetical protein